METAINSLRLVYPPVSNQEAEWLKNDKEVEERLRRSNLYMITPRREARFIWDVDPLRQIHAASPCQEGMESLRRLRIAVRAHRPEQAESNGLRQLSSILPCSPYIRHSKSGFTVAL
jgi:hypothetical protein